MREMVSVAAQPPSAPQAGTTQPAAHLTETAARPSKDRLAPLLSLPRRLSGGLSAHLLLPPAWDLHHRLCTRTEGAPWLPRVSAGH